jgi:hypothetical protein
MINPAIVNVYDEIGTNPVVDIIYAESYKPQPSQGDYGTGQITRYFVQKINQPIVQEVSPENFLQVPDSFYKKVSLTWKITGIQKSKKTGKNVEAIGVEDFNKESILEASKTVDDINKVVKNYLEYWRGY